MDLREATMTAEAQTDDTLYRDAAIEIWAQENLEIDDDAKISSGENGAWVGAWVWVSRSQAGIEALSDTESSD
jgi:hypothetical protein